MHLLSESTPSLPADTRPHAPCCARTASLLYASATFEIPITAIEAADTRVAFEDDFKAAIVASMGSAGVSISAASVEIVAITAGSVIVDFQVYVPAAFESQATAQFQAMATDPSELTIGASQIPSSGVSTSESAHAERPAAVEPTAVAPPPPASSHAWRATTSISLGLGVVAALVSCTSA